VVLGGVVVSLGLALFVAPFACGWPDGLEKVAQALGFEHRAAETPALEAPLPDYGVPGLAADGLSVAVAGAVGTLVAFATAWALASALARAPRAGGGLPPSGPA
jgi:hypothetical protein